MRFGGLDGSGKGVKLYKRRKVRGNKVKDEPEWLGDGKNG